MYVPVRPSQTVIAQYRHISGTPAGQGQQTMPLSRLQLLNSLINNLNTKNTGSELSPLSNISRAQADSLIKQYAAELHKAVKRMPESFGTPGSLVDTGIVFQLRA
ncbi:MAG: hypothetical protein B0D92_05495 [Spirochaeta sp. LUC14_002_19_P3]|nr:MAG: hypothetical protein B0D92_05495 [Spirochaeta sp. LUC14_002_19_P3]